MRYLVTGGGPIGFLTVAALRAEGVTDIVVSEPHERRRELCAQLGARTITPDAMPSAAAPRSRDAASAGVSTDFAMLRSRAVVANTSLRSPTAASTLS